jgi:hypothetical protein
MTLSSVSPDNTGIAPANPVQSANELAFRLAVANAINASNTVVNGNSLVIDAIQRTNYIRSFDVAQLSVGANTIAILSNAVIAWNNTTELEVTGWPAKTFNTTSSPVEMANNFVGYLWIIWDGASVKDYAITSRLIAPAVNYSLLGLYSINGSGVVSITYALERFFESTPNYWRQPQTFLGGFDRQPPVLTASVAANALTVTAARGSLEFRNATLTNGAITTLYNSSASITIPSGTTIGSSFSDTSPIHLYALNNAGTIELALSLNGFIDTTIAQSTTAISGGTNRELLYSTTARASVAVTYVGKLVAPQSFPGTWATAPTNVKTCTQFEAINDERSGSSLQAFNTRTWANFDGTTAANLFGTYSQSAFTVTVNATAHNHKFGDLIQTTIGSGTAVSGTYTVASVTGVDSFTYTAGTSLTTSGSITLNRRAIRASGGVRNVTFVANGDYAVNYTYAMPDVNGLPIVSGSVGTNGSLITVLCIPGTTLNANYTRINGSPTANGTGGLANSSYVNFALIR